MFKRYTMNQVILPLDLEIKLDKNLTCLLNKLIFLNINKILTVTVNMCKIQCRLTVGL